MTDDEWTLVDAGCLGCGEHCPRRYLDRSDEWYEAHLLICESR